LVSAVLDLGKQILLLFVCSVLACCATSGALANEPNGTAAPGATDQSDTESVAADSAYDFSLGYEGSSNSKNLYAKLLFSVVLVAALGIAAIYVSRKVLPRFGHLSGRRIKVVETVYLGQRRGLHLVDVAGRRLLLGSTNESVRTLADVTDGQSTNFAKELAEQIGHNA
jgi:flagellar biosynthetic protein FliO